MAATTTIDDPTTEAIRRALASAVAGRLTEACEIGERAIANGGEPAPLHAMLGMLRGRLGDADRSVDHLRAAHQARPADTIIAGNLASALSQLGRFNDALE